MGTLSEGPSQGYVGPERRRHRVYVTRNSEYHCRGNVCVAVRDRTSQKFVTRHHAIGRKVTSSIRFIEGGGIASISTVDEASVGEQLCFAPQHERDSLFPNGFQEEPILTSAVRAIERPAKRVVWTYPPLHVVRPARTYSP